MVHNVALVGIVLLSFFLRFYKLDEFMMFIGDQGWFYLSARDMIITGQIPLVGPETSHPWLHHGPLWTYMLAIILWLFRFNPVPPAYFIAILGVVTVWLLYNVSSKIFTKRIALIAAFLYATSPLIVLNSRMPYHTSPIPFFTILLFFAVYRWIKGGAYYFPLITFLVGVLYNHELTTFVLSIPIIILFLYGFFKKERWVKKILNKKIIFYSILSFLLPMIPFVIYDINHGYKQTLGFIVWVIYRIIKFPLNVLQPHDLSLNLLQQQSLELLTYLQRLIFEPNLWVGLLILVTSIIYLIYLTLSIYSSRGRSQVSDGTWRSKSRSVSSRQARTINYKTDYVLLFLYIIIPITGLFIHRTPIEADVLLISPFVIMTISVIFDKLANVRFLRIASISFVVFICFANSYFLFKNYLTVKGDGNRMTFSDKINVVESIIKIAKGKEYNLIGKGALDNFPVFTMPYEYLLWWKGHPSEKESVDLKIVVWEKEGEIVVYEQDIKYQKSILR